MGTYQFAINQYLAGKTTVPDLSSHPLQVTAKYGFGVNLEQSLKAPVTIYGRFGWNNGKTETWSFTEVDQTVSAGVGVFGSLWKRTHDRAGVAFAANGISSVHARYLALDGLGSILGDGGLSYPIAAFTWIVVPPSNADPAKRALINGLLRWVLTSGQKECSALGYIPLPRDVADSELRRIESFK
jgi:hypothetical protein